MPDLFIEIGTEEIPAGYIEPALADMGQKLAEFLEKGRVEAGTPEVMGTPRRLVVHIPGINKRQKDVVETYQGPNVKVAYDENGDPTKAAIGFARPSSAISPVSGTGVLPRYLTWPYAIVTSPSV